MKKLLFLLAIMSTSLPAQIYFEPWINLSNTPSATSDYHSVFSGGVDLNFYPNPNYCVVWGDNGEIKFKLSTDDGHNWQANRTISNTPNTCGWPVVAANNMYDVTVLYHTITSGGSYEIICQKSTDHGLSWSAMQKISGTASAITPQLLTDGSNNNLFAVWEERPNNNYEIYFSKSTDFGSTWSAPQNISNTATTSRWVQLQQNSGNLYCAWIETSTYPLSDIYFTKSTDLGTTWSSPVNITNDSRPQNRIFMETDIVRNTIYIASDDIITFNFDEIYLMKSNDYGNTWTQPVNITNNSGNSNTPCLKVFDDIIYFSWSDNTHSAPAYDNSDIFFKWSSDAGSTWNDSTNLSANPETSSRPRICWSIYIPIDQYMVMSSVVWYDYSTGDSEILARNANHFVVPVELTSFTTDVYKNSVMLNWSTVSETNNKGFEVERKAFSEGSWQNISFVPGSGTTTEIKNYSYTDKNLSTGKYIYRLKQLDFDGSFEYSKEIEADISLPVEFSLDQNYPNPFNPVTKIRYSIPADIKGDVKLAVYDLIGNEVAVLVNEEKIPGIYDTEFNGKDLSSGIYFYRLSMNDKILVKKLTLMK